MGSGICRFSADFGSRAKNPEYEEVRKTAEIAKDGSLIDGGWYLLQRKTVVTGDEINSAFTRFNEFGKPEIGLKFRDSGATKMANADKKHDRSATGNSSLVEKFTWHQLFSHSYRQM